MQLRPDFSLFFKLFVICGPIWQVSVAAAAARGEEAPAGETGEIVEVKGRDSDGEDEREEALLLPVAAVGPDAGAAAEAPPEQWWCPTCTLTSDFDAMRCGKCGNARTLTATSVNPHLDLPLAVLPLRLLFRDLRCTIPEHHVDVTAWPLPDRDLKIAADVTGDSCTSLVLDECREISDDGVQRHLSRCGKCEVLSLSRTQISDAGVKALRFANLCKFTASGCPHIGDATLEHLVPLCKMLAYIDVSFCLSVTNVALLAMGNRPSRARGFTPLEVVVLKGCRKISNDGVNYLMNKAGRYLRDLNLAGCLRVSDVALAANDSGLPMLHSLDLSGIPNVRDAGLSYLNVGCTALRTLRLRATSVADIGLGYLGDIPGITALDLEGCDRITDEGFENMLGRMVVDPLDLDGMGERWQPTPLARRLRKVNIKGCFELSDTSVDALLRSCRRLQEIHVSGLNRVTEAGMGCLAKSKVRVRALSIAGRANRSMRPGKGCFGIPRVSSETLVQCAPRFSKTLTCLDLAHQKRLRSDAIDAIATRCVLLESLNLTQCTHVSDASVALIAQNLSRLRNLVLSKCGLVSNNALIFLGNEDSVCAPSLTSLNTNNCPKISDAGLAGIGGLKDPHLAAMVAASAEAMSARSEFVAFRLLEHAAMAAASAAAEDPHLVSSRVTQLRALRLTGCPAVTPYGVELLARGCGTLQDLKLADFEAVGPKDIDRILHLVRERGSKRRLLPYARRADQWLGFAPQSASIVRYEMEHDKHEGASRVMQKIGRQFVAVCRSHAYKMKKMKELLVARERGATEMQRITRGWLAGIRVYEIRCILWEEWRSRVWAEETKATINIQRVYRGFVGRRMAAEERLARWAIRILWFTRWSVKARALRQQRRERSALDIQRVARGRFGRNIARAIREERARILAERNNAAATIQKAWYDYQNSIRTKMANQVKWREVVKKNKGCIALQRIFRGYWVRICIDEMHWAADVVQRAWQEMWRRHVLTRGVLLFQTGWRGHSGRQRARIWIINEQPFRPTQRPTPLLACPGGIGGAPGIYTRDFGWQVRCHSNLLIATASHLQAMYRGRKARRMYEEQRARMIAAAEMIQRNWELYLARMRAREGRLRLRDAILLKKLEFDSARAIQRWWLGRKGFMGALKEKRRQHEIAMAEERARIAAENESQRRRRMMYRSGSAYAVQTWYRRWVWGHHDFYRCNYRKPVLRCGRCRIDHWRGLSANVIQRVFRHYSYRQKFYKFLQKKQWAARVLQRAFRYVHGRHSWQRAIREGRAAAAEARLVQKAAFLTEELASGIRVSDDELRTKACRMLERAYVRWKAWKTELRQKEEEKVAKRKEMRELQKERDKLAILGSRMYKLKRRLRITPDLENDYDKLDDDQRHMVRKIRKQAVEKNKIADKLAVEKTFLQRATKEVEGHLVTYRRDVDELQMNTDALHDVLLKRIQSLGKQRRLMKRVQHEIEFVKNELDAWGGACLKEFEEMVVLDKDDIMPVRKRLQNTTKLFREH